MQLNPAMPPLNTFSVSSYRWKNSAFFAYRTSSPQPWVGGFETLDEAIRHAKDALGNPHTFYGTHPQARDIIEHGAGIWVFAEDSGGSIFPLVFPSKESTEQAISVALPHVVRSGESLHIWGATPGKWLNLGVRGQITTVTVNGQRHHALTTPIKVEKGQILCIMLDKNPKPEIFSTVRTVNDCDVDSAAIEPEMIVTPASPDEPVAASTSIVDALRAGLQQNARFGVYPLYVLQQGPVLRVENTDVYLTVGRDPDLTLNWIQTAEIRWLVRRRPDGSYEFRTANGPWRSIDALPEFAEKWLAQQPVPLPLPEPEPEPAPAPELAPVLIPYQVYGQRFFAYRLKDADYWIGGCADSITCKHYAICDSYETDAALNDERYSIIQHVRALAVTHWHVTVNTGTGHQVAVICFSEGAARAKKRAAEATKAYTYKGEQYFAHWHPGKVAWRGGYSSLAECVHSASLIEDSIPSARFNVVLHTSQDSDAAWLVIDSDGTVVDACDSSIDADRSRLSRNKDVHVDDSKEQPMSPTLLQRLFHANVVCEVTVSEGEVFVKGWRHPYCSDGSVNPARSYDPTAAPRQEKPSGFQTKVMRTVNEETSADEFWHWDHQLGSWLQTWPSRLWVDVIDSGPGDADSVTRPWLDVLYAHARRPDESDAPSLRLEWWDDRRFLVRLENAFVRNEPQADFVALYDWRTGETQMRASDALFAGRCFDGIAGYVEQGCFLPSRDSHLRCDFPPSGVPAPLIAEQAQPRRIIPLDTPPSMNPFVAPRPLLREESVLRSIFPLRARPPAVITPAAPSLLRSVVALGAGGALALASALLAPRANVSAPVPPPAPAEPEPEPEEVEDDAVLLEIDLETAPGEKVPR